MTNLINVNDYQFHKESRRYANPAAKGACMRRPSEPQGYNESVVLLYFSVILNEEGMVRGSIPTEQSSRRKGVGEKERE